MTDRIGVPLELEGFEVTGSEVVNGILEVSVRSTPRPACHHCGSVSVMGHGRNERRVRDRACAYPCVLRWTQRRFCCRDCRATFREQHPEIAGRRRITERFRRRLFERACREPLTDVASGEGVTCYRVLEAFEHHAVAEIETSKALPPRVLALDESAFKRRFQFHTVFSDPERGTIFDLAEGRHQGAVFSGLLKLDDQSRTGIETVVMDCHWPFRRAIELVLPQVRIVADKFHVIRAVDGAAGRVRVRFGRRSYTQRVGRDGGTARQHNPASDPTVFRIRWVFMKRAANLSPTEEEWLVKSLRAAAPEVTTAWWLKERFAAIYDARDPPYR